MDDPNRPRVEATNGLVHYVGLHTDTRVSTECGLLIATSKDNAVHTTRQSLYTTTSDVPTCIVCVSDWPPL